MTDKDANVRLVLLGDADPAPVCEGDVCYLPDSTMDSTAPAADERTGDVNGVPRCFMGLYGCQRDRAAPP